MHHTLTTPLDPTTIKQLTIGDTITLTGTLFTARDRAHEKLIQLTPEELDFQPSNMALYHSGPLMKKTPGGWNTISSGPTTSSRMEAYEPQVIQKYHIPLIIGKGPMGQATQQALKENTCVYTSYTGGAGALAAEHIKHVKNVYYLEEMGMAEAIWILEVESFGPLVVAMDSHGHSLYTNK